MIDPAADLDYFDGLEPVWLRQGESSAETAIPAALRRQLHAREAEASDGKYTAHDVRWHLPAAVLTSAPRVGATIRDRSGDAWRVLEVRHETLAARYVCVSRMAALADGLDARVTVQVAEWTKGHAGAPIARWRDVRTDLPARIQPQQASTGLAHDRRQTRVTHRIVVGEPIAVDHNHRLVQGTQVYHVLGYEQAERIDVLPVILAELASGPLE